MVSPKFIPARLDEKNTYSKGIENLPSSFSADNWHTGRGLAESSNSCFVLNVLHVNKRNRSSRVDLLGRASESCNLSWVGEK